MFASLLRSQHLLFPKLDHQKTLWCSNIGSVELQVGQGVEASIPALICGHVKPAYGGILWPC